MTGACIAGIGAATPLGPTALVTAAAARAGVSGFRDHPYRVDPAGDPHRVAMARYVGVALPPAERLAALVERSLHECLAGWRDAAPRLPVVLAVPGGSRAGLAPDLDEILASTIERTAGRHAGTSSVSLVPGGHAAGLAALEKALATLRVGDADACLVGAADSWFFHGTLEAMDGANRFQSRKNPWGFIPGEAAAFCLLCTERAAQRANVKVRGRVLSVGLAEEQAALVPGAINTGEGLSRAVRAALAAAPSDARVDEVLCDLNGARDRADELGFLFARLGPRLGDEARFWAPATSWGDLGAASAIAALTTAVVVAERGFPRGPHVLVTASSEEGLRGAALLRLPPLRSDDDV
ncbi:hypothetical protein BE04_51155 [Sorangium cellulosum]|uniref:3-oxoacyl-ACP synthase n=1 Tax=Sorangium cellulosum TaxID=56 RepID=A0A150PIA2_SORCE|nr:hypothetical protein BE04_51155 [Sorangium cellulosum]